MVVKHESVFATLFAKTNSSEGDIVRLAAVFIFHTYYVTRVNEAAFAVFIACLHSCKDCLVGIAAAQALVAERVEYGLLVVLACPFVVSVPHEELSVVEKEVADEVRQFKSDYNEEIKEYNEGKPEDQQKEAITSIYMAPDTKRYYPFGNFAAQVLGFVGSDNQGLAGIEAKYDSYLTGTPGRAIRATNAKHPQQIYACKTYNAYGKNHCTQHRIEYDTLYQLVLEEIRACAQAALRDEEVVKSKLSSSCKAEQKAQQSALERSLSKDEERLSVLDKMVLRLYEDLAMGRISEDNFNQMLTRTQEEQAGLKQRVARQRQELAGEIQEASNARQWTEAIKACANLTELDAITLNRLVKEIIVHERIDEEGTRHISVEIHFNLKPLPEATEAIAV